MLRQNLQRMFARFFSRVSVQGAAVAVSSASGAQLAVGGALLGASLYSLRARQASCSDAVHPPELPWSHKGAIQPKTLDAVVVTIADQQQVAVHGDTARILKLPRFRAVTPPAAHEAAIEPKYLDAVVEVVSHKQLVGG